MTAAAPVQDAPPRLNPNFAHRLPSFGDEAVPARLFDVVTNAANRTESILYLLSGQFQDGADKWNDEIVSNVIETAIREIGDIKAFVSAYYDATKGGAA